MTVTESRDALEQAPPTPAEHAVHPGAVEHADPAEQTEQAEHPEQAGHAEHVPGVDDADLATFLRVVDQLVALPHDHPQHAVARRATSGLFKAVKKQRRTQKRAAISAADRAVVAATATGSPGRIDDETLGIPLVSTVRGATAGTLLKARPCYICKELYSEVDAFYHQLCPSCAALNHAKRDARTDLTGRRALLTGGRAKIGMYIALRLLRDGAHTTITTRFPRDAARRFAAMPDAADWLDRLEIVGIDLRDPAQVVALADSVAAAGPLDVLINNAAQTVRRSPGAYSRLADAELAPLPAGPLPAIRTFGHTSDAHPRALAGAVSELTSPTLALAAADADALTAQALTAHAASLERLVAGTSIDAGGLVPDTHDTNSWVATVDEVDPMELLEVQLCNQTAPFILVSRLRPAMRAASARRTYVVNVSAMEGVFSRGYKGPGHPHTNMAKAALNMLTRTSAAELATDGILMTAVDTGWITDERPHPTKVRLAEEGFHAPLDLVDGAARVYDPIVRGEAGEDLFGCFLKDYTRSAW
ncbi:SDR family oxidoreductase [Cellulomonas cellasea]|uniref:NAD(P)-dependent dehydrogenase (Short-subunit alcohol dehydrogenase family) n=1 Tax=Cellulomonas cellasea TaxID=43670 RepID=A0A7W4YAZ5_9CELL|nr:SDR family oxidoreductase [Cellulomonas cellasea]MBB2921956.1 NAD(P)-dependent dehydrogenase (short-subunit alcohol dehydrogenase family) [Cellulomonas cellasea]